MLQYFAEVNYDIFLILKSMLRSIPKVARCLEAEINLWNVTSATQNCHFCDDTEKLLKLCFVNVVCSQLGTFGKIDKTQELT